MGLAWIINIRLNHPPLPSYKLYNTLYINATKRKSCLRVQGLNATKKQKKETKTPLHYSLLPLSLLCSVSSTVSYACEKAFHTSAEY